MKGAVHCQYCGRCISRWKIIESSGLVVCADGCKTPQRKLKILQKNKERSNEE